MFSQFETELHVICISSDAHVDEGEALSITILLSEDDKCIRCWHRDPSVGSVKGHPEICSRCEQNIDHDGEARSFV